MFPSPIPFCSKRGAKDNKRIEKKNKKKITSNIANNTPNIYRQILRYSDH